MTISDNEKPMDATEADSSAGVSCAAASGSPPNGLWLQWHGDGSPDDVGEVSDRDVTWSRDIIFSSDLRYISAQWMTEQAAKYREQAKAVSGDLKDPYRQMAWAFELVLELAAEENV